METIQHKVFDKDGNQFHYVVSGSGEPLLLIHGFPQHWLMWKKIIPALSEHFTVIAIDQRGMGGSSITVSGYDKKTLAGDVNGLVDHLGYSQVSVAGYDLGGGTAYAFTRMYPGKVKKLSIIEYALPGFGYEYGFQPVPNWQSWQMSFFMVPDVAVQFIAGKERELLAWYFWHWSYNPEAISQEDFEIYVRQLQKPGALRAGFSHFAAYFEDAEMAKELSKTKLTVPVLALGGEKGAGNFVLQGMQHLGEDVSGGVVKGAGHWIADEQPRELANQFINFFK